MNYGILLSLYVVLRHSYIHIYACVNYFTLSNFSDGPAGKKDTSFQEVTYELTVAT